MNHGYKKCVKQFLKNSLKSGILDQNLAIFKKVLDIGFHKKNVSNRFDQWSKNLFDTEYEYF